MSGEWMPIDTAPTDGTRVDVWYEDDGRVTNAHFRDGRWLKLDRWRRPSRRGGKWVPQYSCRLDAQPTHWMPPPAPPGSSVPRPDTGEGETHAARDVLAERRRQVEVEGWMSDHDDAHDAGQMAVAAACYANASAYKADPNPSSTGEDDGFLYPPKDWPWDESWWKPTTIRRDLVKAGALILAEIERLDRAALSGEAAR